jgi:uncharacterized protein (DUF1800 family)
MPSCAVTATTRKADSAAAKRLPGGLRAKLVPYYLDQVAARYRVAVHTEESFRERLVHFWTNHFAVSADKPQVLALAGALENEAIRPHVAGRSRTCWPPSRRIPR